MSDKSQPNLFGDRVLCPDVQNLPLIVSANNDCEVLAPGSVYQPLLLDQKDNRVVSGPGSLNREEEKFVRDLITFLYPKANYPKSASSPLIWGNRKVWLKRNIEKDPRSFRLRVDNSDWYYPDFVIWIIDEESRIQTFGFADPKGLAIGAHGGWSEYKVVCSQIVPHILQREFGQVKLDDKDWVFRIRGVLVSISSYDGLREQRKFFVRDANDREHPPTKKQFEEARIVFQEQRAEDYIPSVLRLLVEDNELDKYFAAGSDFCTDKAPAPILTELQADMSARRGATRSTSHFAASIVEDFLMPGPDGRLGARSRQKRMNLVNRLVAGEDQRARTLWDQWPNKDEPCRFLLRFYPDVID